MGRSASNKGAKALCNRIIILYMSVCLGAGVVLLPLSIVSAQQRPFVKDKEADRVRRAKAVDLIVETADAARTFKDLFYRARIQTLAADALWPHDEQRARAIFRRAWEAATAYDKLEQEEEERESGVPSALPVTEARDEVLVKVAARDAALSETFLQDLLDDKKEAEKSAKQDQPTPQRRTPWRELSDAGQRRLALAYELLKQKHPSRAADVATPVINEGESGELMAFITRLRESDTDVGETFYLRLLDRTRLDRNADTNTVLLLSSQIISPWLLIVVDEHGSLQFRRLDTTLTGATLLPFVSQPVRSAFYNVAASILLRPLVPRAGQNMTPEAVSLYFAIGRLLPYFEREAPRYVVNLRLRITTSANEIEAGQRETLESQFGLQSLTPERAGDLLRPQIDQLGRARDAADRDRIALGIVKKASQHRLWDRARRAAIEIEDVDVRRSALSYIAVCQIGDLLRTFEDDKEENVDRLAKFVRSADVPSLVTAWGLAQIAIMAKRKGDIESASALLDEAETFAARTPAGTWQRVAGYTVVALMAARINEKRAWEIVPELVRAANAFEDFAGDETSIDIEAGGNNAEDVLEPLSIGAEVFRLDGIFVTMAQLDYEKAMTAARSIGRETPRAFASLAIARVMLNPGVRSQKSEFRRYENKQHALILTSDF